MVVGIANRSFLYATAAVLTIKLQRLKGKTTPHDGKRKEGK